MIHHDYIEFSTCRPNGGSSLYYPATLDKKTIDFLSKIGMVQEFDKESIIFLESDPAHYFYFILEGRIKISRLNRNGKEVVIAILGSGNFFGEMSLLDGFPRSADATVLEKSKLLLIQQNDFYTLLETSPVITAELLKELAHRLRNSDSQIKGLSILNARGKVATALLRWAQDQGEFKENKVIIIHAPKQQEMASYIGLSRETFNRILHDLKDEGFIEIPRTNTIVIQKYREFKKIFGPFY